MGWCGHAGGWGGGFMMIAWVILIGALVYWIIRTGQKSGPSVPQSETALDILKKRYARGEITQAEFEERKRDVQ